MPMPVPALQASTKAPARDHLVGVAAGVATRQFGRAIGEKASTPAISPSGEAPWSRERPLPLPRSGRQRVGPAGVSCWSRAPPAPVPHASNLHAPRRHNRQSAEGLRTAASHVASAGTSMTGRRNPEPVASSGGRTDEIPTLGARSTYGSRVLAASYGPTTPSTSTSSRHSCLPVSGRLPPVAPIALISRQPLREVAEVCRQSRQRRGHRPRPGSGAARLRSPDGASGPPTSDAPRQHRRSAG